MPEPRFSRWRRGLAAGALLALPFSVAACGDDEPEGPDVIDEQETIPPNPEEQTPAPDGGVPNPGTEEPGDVDDPGGDLGDLEDRPEETD